MNARRELAAVFAGRHIVLAGALVASFLWIAMSRVATGPYGYDESDYMFAASRGMWANWTDSPTGTLAQFVRAGTTSGLVATERESLSAAIRSSNDVLFYRHWHGPVFYYFLVLLSPFHGDEHWVRTATLCFPVATGLIIYFGVLWALSGTSFPRESAAALATGLFFWNHTVIHSSGIGPHQLFVTCVIIALVVITRVYCGGDRKGLYVAAAACGVAFATIELAFALVLTFALFLLLISKGAQVDLRLAARCSVVFLASIFTVWPAALLKLSFLKAYGFMVYLLLFRRGAWGNVTFAATWMDRLQRAPMQWMLALVAILLWAVWSRRAERHPADVFLGFSILTMVPLLLVKTDVLRYTLSFAGPLSVFTGVTIAGSMRAWNIKRRATVIVVLFGLQLAAVWANLGPKGGPDARPSALIAAIRQQGLQHKRLLVPQSDLPTLHFYFPDATLRTYAEQVAPLCDGFDAIIEYGTPTIVKRVERSPSGAPELPAACGYSRS